MMTQISEDEARALLHRGSLARLGRIVDGDSYVLPVNYFFEDDWAYVHSLPGQKSLPYALIHAVAFRLMRSKKLVVGEASSPSATIKN